MKLTTTLKLYKFMKQIFDYRKEEYRGTLKQIMKVRGLRTISLANYIKWLRSIGEDVDDCPVHSLKIDLQDGYINAFAYGTNEKCGVKIDDADAREYRCAKKLVNDLLKREHEIPTSVKRNILVKISR